MLVGGRSGYTLLGMWGRLAGHGPGSGRLFRLARDSVYKYSQVLHYLSYVKNLLGR